MPSDEYSAAAGGALKLKGGKVEKHKKKHKHRHHKDKERLEKAAEAAEAAEAEEADKDKERGEPGEAEAAKTDKTEETESDPYARMTPAERRFAEAQDKKIRDLLQASPEAVAAARPDLLKSHKERLADLNTYLSRMSEHHDMPKIGPG